MLHLACQFLRPGIGPTEPGVVPVVALILVAVAWLAIFGYYFIREEILGR